MAPSEPIQRGLEKVSAARERAAALRRILDDSEEESSLEDASEAFLQAVGEAAEEVSRIRENQPGLDRLREEMGALAGEYESLAEGVRAVREEVGAQLIHLRQGGQTLKAYAGGAGSDHSYYFDSHT
ncbi:MAG TPA: hypothetical protein VKA48_02490 [Gammaproteobacteria bacterium]|nr:hypothetical protein [Gammaproteobacteria bacterium]